MDKRDWAPEELKLKEAIDKLYETDKRTPSKPLDLSFMDEPMKTELPEKAPPKEKIYKKHPALTRVAAIVAIILASSFTTAVCISNDYVSAVRDSIEKKVFEMKHGVVVANEDEYVEEGETVWEIEDIELVEKAKKIVPELSIPSYLPDGYSFSKLKLFLYNDGTYSARYLYEADSTEISIRSQPLQDESILYSGNTENTVQTDRYMASLWNDPMANCQGATIFFEDVLYDISTNNVSISKDEMIRIINGL